MNVIHLIMQDNYPDVGNDISELVLNLAAIQSNLSDGLSVWIFTPNPENYTIIPGDNIEVNLFTPSNSLWGLDKPIKDAISDIEKPAVVHFHGGLNFEFYKISKLLKNRKIPYAVMPHGVYSPQKVESLKIMDKVYFSLFEKDYIKNAAFVQFKEPKERNETSQYFKKINSLLLPLGRKINDCPQKTKAHKIPVFGFVGLIKYHKSGLDLLLNGFSIYKRQLNGNGKLWLIGTGNDFETTLKLGERLNILNDINFFGLDLEHVRRQLILQLDACFESSRTPETSRPFLEAALSGIPCVVQENSEISSFVNKYNAGLLMDDNTPRSIAKAMKQVEVLKREHLLSELGHNAREMVYNEFNIDSAAKKLYTIYESIV